VSIRLWGRASSVNVQKILWALDEAGLAFERIDAGGKYGVTDRDAFGAMNPARRVPVLEEDGFVLWESHAILRYLGRHPAARQALTPATQQASAIMDQWMEFTTSTLQPPFIAAFWQLVRMRPAERSSEVLAKAGAEFAAALRILDGRLADQAFLVGDRFSLADIAAGSLMHRARDCELVPTELANVRRWADSLAARPAYGRHVAVSYEELRVT
jgi:glutathione S-transferase